MRNLTASDRSALIRLASSLPKGDPTRSAILAGLNRKAASYDREPRRVPMGEWRKFSVTFKAFLDGSLPCIQNLQLTHEIQGLDDFDLEEALVGVDGNGSFISLFDGRSEALYEGPKVPSEKAEAFVAQVSKSILAGKIPSSFKQVMNELVARSEQWFPQY
jgi:hypothetical protein